MTIFITNSYTANLSLSLGSNVETSFAINNSSATLFLEASRTQYTFSTRWVERIYVGLNINLYGSKIKGNFTGLSDIDVSYVDGYSVSIICSLDNIPIFDYNINLFDQKGILCVTEVVGPMCLNSSQNILGGPPLFFFAVYVEAVYIYPQDNSANQGNLQSNMISCYIDTSCMAPSR